MTIGRDATTRPGKVTIYDVADLAGASPSTVSRALSKPGRVSYATAEKVRTAAAELGYKSRLATLHAADGLDQAPTGNIAIVVADLLNPFFLEIVRGAEHAARAQGIQVVIANVEEHEERSRKAVEALTRHVDGVMLASSRLANQDIEKVARTMPAVVINRPVPGVPSVLVDNYEGVIKAAIHLEQQGARSITYLAGPDRSWADATRWRGLLDAVGSPSAPLGAAAATFTRSTQIPADQARRLARMNVRMHRVVEPTALGGRRAFQRWCRERTDAVLCFNDLVAVGFIQQARAHGMRVPEDVAVIGFDNTEVTTIVTPSLTTVAAPLRAVGRVAAANLIALIMGVKEPPARPRVLPTRLIVRESSVRALR
ncbi:LacI family DNA-binding transcriptional regulator [Corynebacterium sp. Marseille-Q2516]